MFFTRGTSTEKNHQGELGGETIFNNLLWFCGIHLLSGLYVLLIFVLFLNHLAVAVPALATVKSSYLKTIVKF